MNVERLRQAYAFIAATPQEHVYLNFYHNGSTECPRGCALGLMAAAGMFGLTADEAGFPTLLDECGNTLVEEGTFPVVGQAAGRIVFGLELRDQQSTNLFGSALKSKYDAYAPDGWSHKQLFLHRMECFFKEHNLGPLVLPEAGVIEEREHATCL